MENNNDSIEDLSYAQSDETIPEVYNNIDDPNRHNIAGYMNRPVRNSDPLSSRNIEHKKNEEWLKKQTQEYIETPFEKEVNLILSHIQNMLSIKNRKYGNSALEPKRIFAKSDTVEQIKVRIDDKLNRIANAQSDEDEDVIDDLIGYLVLLKIANTR